MEGTLFFFLLLLFLSFILEFPISFLYIREGFEKNGESEGIRRQDARKCTVHHLMFGFGGGRGPFVIVEREEE